MRISIYLCGLVFAFACTTAFSFGPGKKKGEFDKELLKIAREYQQWHNRVNEEMFKQMPCAAVVDRNPSQTDSLLEPRITLSHQGQQRGTQMFQLFVRSNWAYTGKIAEAQPNDQAIVKETWATKEVPASSASETDPSSPMTEFVRLHPENKKFYQPVKRDLIYIMYKTDKHPELTDNGWVYAVVNPDKMEVIQAGKIANCMSCHTQSKYDRVIGLDGLE